MYKSLPYTRMRTQVCGSVIVDESMLTGEAVPVVKTALPPASASENDHELELVCPIRDKGCALLCGTTVVDVSPGESGVRGGGGGGGG